MENAVNPIGPSARVVHCAIAVALSGALLLAGCTEAMTVGVVAFGGVGHVLTQPSGIAEEMFHPKDPDRRRRGVVRASTSDVGSQEFYLRSYRTLLTDPDATVRAAAAQALGSHGKEEDALRLASSLEDESVIVRWEAAKALQRLHHKDVIVPLSHRMRFENEPDLDVRQAATAAMAQYQTEYAFESLVNVLKDDDFGVRYEARQSLLTLTGENLGFDRDTWKQWAERHKGKLFTNARGYKWKRSEHLQSAP